MSRARFAHLPAPPLQPLLLLLLVSLVLGASVRLPASESRQLASTWRGDRDVRVDGVDEEWRDVTLPVKGQRFAVGFINDADALYFCLVTKDSMTIRQISRLGLILWLDRAGGKKKTFGIRFPAAYGAGLTNPARKPPREPAPSSPGAGTAPPAGGQEDIAILGPGRNDARDIENDKSGVSARFAVREDLLVYEVKVPLRRSDSVPFAPDVDAGAALRVELQTPEWRGPVPLRRGGPMIGVGVGGPGGGIFYPGADTALLKPLDIAADLRLATGPS